MISQHMQVKNHGAIRVNSPHCYKSDLRLINITFWLALKQYVHYEFKFRSRIPTQRTNLVEFRLPYVRGILS